MTSTSILEEKYYTHNELQPILRVSDPTLRRWRTLGIGPDWVKVGGRVRYYRVDVDRWLASRVRAR